LSTLGFQNKEKRGSFLHTFLSVIQFEEGGALAFDDLIDILEIEDPSG